jgi:sirohydrochlorin ferrochelatase
VSAPTLVVAAHGSASPAGRAAVRELVELVGSLVSPAAAVVGWLDHEAPTLAEVVRSAGSAVIVPLLLSGGYHARVDVPGQAGAAVVSEPVGPHPAVIEALAARLTESGAPPEAPVVLAAAGSADDRALADVRAAAAALGAVSVGYVVGSPTVAAAVAALRRQTGARVAVSSYLIGPGRSHDAVRACGANWIAAPIGAHPGLARAVVDRYSGLTAPTY